jgi:S-adenosylmethionine synthetase
VLVHTFGTGKVPDRELERAVREVFDLTPKGIIRALHLRSPIYHPTAAYGHFGRRPHGATVEGKRVQLFPWERSDRVKAMLRAVR